MNLQSPEPLTFAERLAVAALPRAVALGRLSTLTSFKITHLHKTSFAVGLESGAIGVTSELPRAPASLRSAFTSRRPKYFCPGICWMSEKTFVHSKRPCIRLSSRPTRDRFPHRDRPSTWAVQPQSERGLSALPSTLSDSASVQQLAEQDSLTLVRRSARPQPANPRTRSRCPRAPSTQPVPFQPRRSAAHDGSKL